MKASPDSDWYDTHGRRRLTPGEVAALRSGVAGRPADAARLEEELALEALLEGLPAAPRTAGNFTARVLGEIRRPAPAERPRAHRPWDWLRSLRLVHGLALTAIALVATGGWNRFQTRQRGQLARSVLEVSHAAEIPGVTPASFGDFDAVQKLHVAPRPEDDALVAALLHP